MNHLSINLHVGGVGGDGDRDVGGGGGGGGVSHPLGTIMYSMG
jgi:hypothetical protein